MTVLENVLVGAHARLRPFSERKGRAEALETLEYLELDPLAERLASGLPFGTLKRIDLARALASKPRLLLLDEPAAGLNHEEVEGLASLIRALRKEFELAILLVEHHILGEPADGCVPPRRAPHAEGRGAEASLHLHH